MRARQDLRRSAERGKPARGAKAPAVFRPKRFKRIQQCNCGTRPKPAPVPQRSYSLLAPPRWNRLSTVLLAGSRPDREGAWAVLTRTDGRIPAGRGALPVPARRIGRRPPPRRYAADVSPGRECREKIGINSLTVKSGPRKGRLRRRACGAGVAQLSESRSGLPCRVRNQGAVVRAGTGPEQIAGGARLADDADPCR